MWLQNLSLSLSLCLVPSAQHIFFFFKFMSIAGKKSRISDENAQIKSFFSNSIQTCNSDINFQSTGWTCSIWIKILNSVVSIYKRLQVIFIWRLEAERQKDEDKVDYLYVTVLWALAVENTKIS